MGLGSSEPGLAGVAAPLATTKPNQTYRPKLHQQQKKTNNNTNDNATTQRPPQPLTATFVPDPSTVTSLETLRLVIYVIDFPMISDGPQGRIFCHKTLLNKLVRTAVKN